MPIVDYATCAAGNAKLTYAKVDDEIEVCSGYGGNNPVSIYFYLFIHLTSQLVSYVFFSLRLFSASLFTDPPFSRQSRSSAGDKI